MDRLPKEIVLLIIKDFSYKEKLACALVCQKWLTWIRDSSLYKTLRFSDRGGNLQQAFEYFIDRDYGYHVTNLEILDYDLDLDQFLILPDLFPNLKQFKFTVEEEMYEYKDLPVTDMNSAERDLRIQQWTNLEVISELNNWLHPVTLVLLRSPESVRLTSITLNLPKDGISYNPSKDLLRSIHNAPALQSLTVDCITLTVQDLDLLLKSTPRLKTLVFTSFSHSLEDEDEDEELSQPRNNVQNVTISFSESMELEVDQWIDYFSMYTSIISLTMVSEDSLQPPSHAVAAIESSLIDAFSNWTRLKEYNMGFAPLAAPILQAMADNRVELQDLTMYTIFRLGTDQFNLLGSSTLAQKIRSLHIVGGSVDYLEHPDGSFSRLMDKMMNLGKIMITSFEYLSEKDPNIITHLMYNAPNVKKVVVPSLTTDPPLDNPLPTNFTSQLTHLDVNYCQFDFSVVDSDVINVSFEHALQHCPYLETFESFVNIYKSIEDTTLGEEDTLKFRFNNQRSLKKIKISSLYHTCFKIIRNGHTKYYRQLAQKELEEIDHIDKGCLYITIETDDKAIIETVVLE